jgi:hypothetical protein
LPEFYSLLPAIYDNGFSRMDGDVTGTVPANALSVFCVFFTDDEHVASVMIMHVFRELKYF